MLTPRDVENFYSSISFSKNAIILYEGCYTALSPGKTSLGQKTADITGCDTIAIIDETEYTNRSIPKILTYYTRELGQKKVFKKKVE